MIDYKKLAHSLTPLIRVGKNGMTESQIIEIDKSLKKRKIIKIKFLKSFPDKEKFNEIVEDLIKKTKSKLISKKGFVIVLAK